MKAHQVIRWLAVASLMVLNVMSILSLFSATNGSLWERGFQMAIGAAIWGFLTYKIWMRPRWWGLGVGIYLIVVLVFQTHLWRLAVTSPNRDKLNVDPSVVNFIIHEIPLAVGAICCLLLRWCYPVGNEQNSTQLFSRRQ